MNGGSLVRKFPVLAHETGERRLCVREMQVITHGVNDGIAFGSEIPVLAHRAEGQRGLVCKNSILTHGTIFEEH